jgi:hypothetical protein
MGIAFWFTILGSGSIIARPAFGIGLGYAIEKQDINVYKGLGFSGGEVLIADFVINAAFVTVHTYDWQVTNGAREIIDFLYRLKAWITISSWNSTYFNFDHFSIDHADAGVSFPIQSADRQIDNSLINARLFV